MIQEPSCCAYESETTTANLVPSRSSVPCRDTKKEATLASKNLTYPHAELLVISPSSSDGVSSAPPPQTSLKMHSPQPSIISNQSSQPPLPPSVPISVLPPLPPGPPPEPPSPAPLSVPPLNQPNGSVEKTVYLSYAGSNQECYGVELPYPNPFDYQFPPPQTPDPFFQRVPYYPPMSVPPPIYSVPQHNFSFPPPMLSKPPPPFEPAVGMGIPFPPPGYESSSHAIQKDTSSIDARDCKRQRDSGLRRSRSKSPSHSSTRSSSKTSRSSKYSKRSRSRSFTSRKSRSRSRSCHGVIINAHHDRARRSRSSSLVKRSRVKSRHRSRSRSRGKQQSRSPNHRRRSRSVSKAKKRSRSNSRLSRKSPLVTVRSKDRLRKRSRSSSRAQSLVKRRERLPKSRSPSRHSALPRSGKYCSSSSKSPKRETKVELSSKDTRGNSKMREIDKSRGAKGEVQSFKESEGENRKNSESATVRKSCESSKQKNGETLPFKRNGESSLQQPIKSDRESLVERWRLNNCKNLEEMANKLDVLSKMEADEIIELEKQTWTRSAPADLYYKRHPSNPSMMEASPKLLELCEHFEFQLCQRATREREKFPPYQPSLRKAKFKMCQHADEGSSSSVSSSCEDSSSDEEDKAMLELERKRKHPQRLHSELWHNEPGEMNDGPLCRCSHRARRSGIRHNVYVGEQKLEKCNINTNNAGKLYHYRITMSPPVNFLTKTPTIIEHDSHEYIFEGFSLFSHFPLVKLPTCKVIRFNIEYTILYVDESMPENFTIRELDLFYDFLFHEVLELVDLDLRAFGDPIGCNQFHFMPRFVRDLPENGKEILSMNEVLKYLLKSNKPLVPEERLNEIYNMSLYDWQSFADEVKCMVVTKPGMRPCSLRVDQLDRETMDEGRFPEIVHFGIRPPQLSYAGNTEYQKHWREYVKFRHLLANMPKPSAEDKRKLMGKEIRLQEMRTVSKMKRDVTIALSSEGFCRTGIMCDIIQHALLLPVLVCHLRFHKSLDQLEEDMDYKFKNRYLLQLALTHPSYRENFGTNPDHARNSLTNCGIRQPEYGDRRIHYMNTRKRGINTLIQIMSRFGKKEATESNIGHNERLEFLGDAVVEFISSIHLFHLFPDLEEGGLATYRAAIVQNQHLAVMAKRLNLDSYMLYAHGSDLCHDLELRHAMANCFEALMGALFLDGGIEIADKVFGHTLWKEESNLTEPWMNYPLHPLQEQEPAGDRQWIQHFAVLQKLTEFESRTGIVYKHIRLLARAFTDRSVGYTNLTLGSNQRLEFLGDTVLQIIASEYLYKFFPEHHEGHLSLLRSSLVNNRTQAVVCDDLGMTDFALYANPKHDVKTKDRADLLEAYLGALYIDKGLKHCHLFCEVCFFPRLQDFIMNQDWNDPKSKLQQCCLTLRTMEGGEPDIPVYKVIQCMGPTNTRIYTVAVYFRGERLAQASGHSIQQAEMNAANEALELSTELFPQLDHQRRVIAKSMKKQKKRARREAALKAARELELRAAKERVQNHRSHDQRDRRSGRRVDDWERNRDRDRGRDRDRERDRDRDPDRDRERDRDRDPVRDEDRDRSRISYIDKGRGKEKHRGRERSGDRDRYGGRGRDQETKRGQRKTDKDRERGSRSHESRVLLKEGSYSNVCRVSGTSRAGSNPSREINCEAKIQDHDGDEDRKRRKHKHKHRHRHKHCKGTSRPDEVQRDHSDLEGDCLSYGPETDTNRMHRKLRHKRLSVSSQSDSSPASAGKTIEKDEDKSLKDVRRSESPGSQSNLKVSGQSGRSSRSSPANSRDSSPQERTSPSPSSESLDGSFYQYLDDSIAGDSEDENSLSGHEVSGTEDVDGEGRMLGSDLITGEDSNVELLTGIFSERKDKGTSSGEDTNDVESEGEVTSDEELLQL